MEQRWNEGNLVKKGETVRNKRRNWKERETRRRCQERSSEDP